VGRALAYHGVKSLTEESSQSIIPMFKGIPMSKLILRYTLVAILFIPFGTFAREIAITFDDAPTPDSALMTGLERTKKLIAALQKANVPDALFYVKADYINPQTAARLEQY